MDKLILKKQPISKSYRSVMVPMDTYEKMAQLKEESGLSYSNLFTCLVEFAMEHVVIEED